MGITISTFYWPPIIAGSVGPGSFPLLAPDGSAAAPSYSFSNGPSYGMYYSTNSLNFASNGTLALSFSSAQAALFSGDVTVSNAAATTNLNVSNANASGIANIALSGAAASTGDQVIQFTTASGNTWSMGKDTSATDAFKISDGTVLGTNDRLQILKSGQVSVAGANASTGYNFRSGSTTAQTLLTGVTQGSLLCQINGNSSATTVIEAANIQANSQATSFTTGILRAAHLSTGVGAGSTATRNIALSMVYPTGGTNNAAITDAPTTFTGNYFIHSTATSNPSLISGSWTATAFIPSSSTIPTNGLYLPNTNTSGIACNSANVATFAPTGVSILGTTTNNNASAGFAGEYIESIISTPTNFGTTAQLADATSISLTAGDWDIYVSLTASANGATVTSVEFGVSTTSGNSATGLVNGDSRASILPPTATANNAGFVYKRVSLSATTTHYLKVRADYSVATPQYQCKIAARRPR